MQNHYIAIFKDKNLNETYVSNYDSQVTYRGKKCLPCLDLTDLNIQSVLDNEKEFKMTILKKNININFNECKVEIININVQNELDSVFMYKGIVNLVTEVSNVIVLDIKPLSFILKRGTGSFFSQYCRARLGDEQCGKDLSSFSFEGRVKKIFDERTFAGDHFAQSPSFFTDGTIIFNKNKQNEFRTQVVIDNGNSFTILLKPEQEVQINDEYFIIAGCNKTLSMCVNKFNNVINFRGEPFIF